MTDIGHNSGQRLKSFIERVERLESEMDELKTDRKEVLAEAKAVGFCTKTIRKIIKDRKKTPEQRQEEQYMLETYKNAISME